jgi:hypothetical protein
MRIKKWFNRKNIKKQLKKGSLGAVWTGPERSKEILDEGFATMSKYKDTYDK